MVTINNARYSYYYSVSNYCCYQWTWNPHTLRINILLLLIRNASLIHITFLVSDVDLNVVDVDIYNSKKETQCCPGDAVDDEDDADAGDNDEERGGRERLLLSLIR